MNDEMKSLIEDAARLLGHKLAYLQHSETPYIADKNGKPTYYIFNPADPERGDLMNVTEAAQLGISFFFCAVAHTSGVHETFTKGDYQSLALAILRAASAVMKARGG